LIEKTHERTAENPAPPRSEVLGIAQYSALIACSSINVVRCCGDSCGLLRCPHSFSQAVGIVFQQYLNQPIQARVGGILTLRAAARGCSRSSFRAPVLAAEATKARICATAYALPHWRGPADSATRLRQGTDLWLSNKLPRSIIRTKAPGNSVATSRNSLVLETACSARRRGRGNRNRTTRALRYRRDQIS
jgi:hypothetical protein